MDYLYVFIKIPHAKIRRARSFCLLGGKLVLVRGGGFGQKVGAVLEERFYDPLYNSFGNRGIGAQVKEGGPNYTTSIF